VGRLLIKASEDATATFPFLENGISNAKASGKDSAIALRRHICKEVKTFCIYRCSKLLQEAAIA
jgi:hypothetical protein